MTPGGQKGDFAQLPSPSEHFIPILSASSTPYSSIWLVGISPAGFRALGPNLTLSGRPVKLMLRGRGKLIVTRLSGSLHFSVSAAKSLNPGLTYGSSSALGYLRSPCSPSSK